MSLTLPSHLGRAQPSIFIAAAINEGTKQKMKKRRLRVRNEKEGNKEDGKRQQSPWAKIRKKEGRNRPKCPKPITRPNCSISKDTQGPIAQSPIQIGLLYCSQAQSELGPEIFKAHFEYAPATSKVITDKWLSCPPEPGNTSVRFHEHNSNIPNSIYIIIFL